MYKNTIFQKKQSNLFKTHLFKICLSCFIFSLLFWGNVQGDILEFGTQEALDKRAPIYPYYGFSLSQSIILASELNNQNMTISEISFYYNGEISWSDNVVVYMGTTSKESFSSTSDWIPLSEMTTVYNDLYSVSNTDGWFSITLNSEFQYDGVDNLVIMVDENTSNWYGEGNDDFYCSNVGANRSIYYYHDDINPDPASPPTARGFSSYRADIKINYTINSSGGDEGCDLISCDDENIQVDGSLNLLPRITEIIPNENNVDIWSFYNGSYDAHELYFNIPSLYDGNVECRINSRGLYLSNSEDEVSISADIINANNSVSIGDFSVEDNEECVEVRVNSSKDFILNKSNITVSTDGKIVFSNNEVENLESMAFNPAGAGYTHKGNSGPGSWAPNAGKDMRYLNEASRYYSSLDYRSNKRIIQGLESGVVYTISAYIKANNGNYGAIYIGGASGNTVHFPTNEWTRVSGTSTVVTTPYTTHWGVIINKGDLVIGFGTRGAHPDTSLHGADVLITQVQIEKGTEPTPFVVGTKNKGDMYVGGNLVTNSIQANSFKVGDWVLKDIPDYVFEDNYNLKTLDEVNSYISTNKHLPDVPSAYEIKNNGLDLVEMSLTLLKKIEELTLYTIEQGEKIEMQQEEIDKLKNKN